MEYTIISGDSHVDLTWLPGDLFASNAPADMAAKMPKVVEDERGKSWRANGIELGGVGGLGFTGEKVEKGWSKRLDRMISLGFYEDGAKGLFHPTTPELRAKDQDLDGVEAEVIYGILGVGLNLKDPEAMSLVYHIYNDWAADFCKSNPERFRALACIPNHDPAEAASELRRASGLGLRGADFAVASASKPMYHEDWDVLWEAAEETQAPISFHTVGFTPRQPDPEEAEEYERRYKAVRITMFQLSGVEYLASVIFSGACDRHPGLRFVLGESGVSWLPYVLDRMDHEYEDRFYHLNLSMTPREFWLRQGFSTYQKETIDPDMVPLMGEDNIIWGSDYPHPDGVWPDSLATIAENLAGVPAGAREKITRTNAGKLYGFIE